MANMADLGAAAQPVIGVIGGMGPEATVDLMRRVIAATPAADDIDHVRMIVDNNPKVPSRLKALLDGTGDGPGPVLAGMARGLQSAGADVLVIPCNTAHFYLAPIRAAVSIPVGTSVDGMPVGLQVVARRSEEELVLACGAIAEANRPWPKFAPLAYS